MTHTRLVDQAPAPFSLEDEEHLETLVHTGRWGRLGAGAILIAEDTGRMLLMRRKEGVEEAGTYGCCAGAHNKFEAPITCARREAGEETGWAGEPEDLKLIPAFVYLEPDFTFSNFIGVIPNEFEPLYGWESDGHIWCTTDNLPSPLHFGIDALLADPASRALIEGGWREVIYAPIDWSKADPIDDEEDATFEETSSRSLSPETIGRIKVGISKFIGSSPMGYPNIHFGVPWIFPRDDAPPQG